MRTNLKLVSLVAFILGFTAAAQAKTVCAMTFNSENERQVFQKNLAPLGYDVVELTPDSKDPNWFSRSCNSQIKCDILLMSGHFGGLFFGEGAKPSTLAVSELTAARENNSCGNILDAQAVYLMGCNTLASKTPDHRTIYDYLRVLIYDGFPLNLAEGVASARYLQFGQSMSEKMSHIFSNSKLIAGFDSTGPLGAQAAPLLQKAFSNSTQAEKMSTGIGAKALSAQFTKHNMRILNPSKTALDPNIVNAISIDPTSGINAWKNILSSQASIKKYWDFLIRQQNNGYLNQVISNDATIRARLDLTFADIIKTAQGLSSIQLKSLNFLKRFLIIPTESHTNAVLKIVAGIVIKPIDYVSADQLCEIFKEQKGLVLPSTSQQKIAKSTYNEYLSKCRGEKQPVYDTPTMSCLNSYGNAWACLTGNAMHLDVPACQFAKSKNADPENSDDMLWFCYDNLLRNDQLRRADCLELTHSFSILSNQLKMNWNCVNRVSQ
jgi:hypothetical protein